MCLRAAHRETPILKLMFRTMQAQTHLSSCSLEPGAHIFLTFSIGVVMPFFFHQRLIHPPISFGIFGLVIASHPQDGFLEHIFNKYTMSLTLFRR
jgi:hypothetical protein